MGFGVRGPYTISCVAGLFMVIYQANKTYNLHFELKFKIINFLKNTPEKKLTYNMKYKSNNFSVNSQLTAKPVNCYLNKNFSAHNFKFKNLP
jgi:hypothetical protein